jgi:RNA polymerase sigma factor (sigma-70 family)
VQHPLNREQILLEGLVANDRLATEQVYRDNHKTVIAWVSARGGSSTDGEDVFQEAMVILFQKAQQAEFRLSCKIGTYLVAVSKYIWYKKLQQQQRQPDFLPHGNGDEDGVHEDRIYEDDIKVQEEREVHFEQLNLALEELGEPCRSLLKAFYNEDKSMQEIAKSFGYTNQDNAKTQKYKCLTRLKKLFYNAQVNK